VILVLKEKAEVLQHRDEELHSERMTLPVPSVIRLVHFVRVPFRARAPLSRRSVFVRDGHRCQYCGAAAENIDHVVPRSRGGTHTWDNVVAACRPCNSRKEDRLPHEIGFALRRPPAIPRERVWIVVASGGVRADWKQYLRLPADALTA
jgi:5-methylcytosine-specific restriction endonuclease McrA